MTTYKTLDLKSKDDLELYSDLLNKSNQKRPYDVPDFFYNFSNGSDDLIAFYYRENDNFFILPGYSKSIPNNKPFLDFSSPYGYSGPITNTANFDFLIRAWTQIGDILYKRNYVSCFIRFSLDAITSGFPGKLVPTLKNIRGVILNEDEQWKFFDYKVRKNVNKAQREGLVSKFFTGNEISKEVISDFYSIYLHTMKRNNADESFFYSQENFMNYALTNQDLAAFGFVYDDKRPISAEMLLISADSIYSFLGGTDSEFFTKRPNDLLKYEIINWARRNGFKYYVLGGGYGKEDGIFKYKASFFPKDIVDYSTGRWIINEDVYNKITCSLEKNVPQNEDNEINGTDYFPEYRKYLK